jgi:hypothetical protein
MASHREVEPHSSPRGAPRSADTRASRAPPAALEPPLRKGLRRRRLASSEKCHRGRPSNRLARLTPEVVVGDRGSREPARLEVVYNRIRRIIRAAPHATHALASASGPGVPRSWRARGAARGVRSSGDLVVPFLSVSRPYRLAVPTLRVLARGARSPQRRACRRVCAQSADHHGPSDLAPRAPPGDRLVFQPERPGAVGRLRIPPESSAPHRLARPLTRRSRWTQQKRSPSPTSTVT